MSKAKKRMKRSGEQAGAGVVVGAGAVVRRREKRGQLL